jgi:hypothetical protein
METDTGNIFEYSGIVWRRLKSDIPSGFTPSDYDTDLTMDGTAQGVALASGVKLGGGKIHVANRGATTEAIRIAFGTSEVNAESNLNMTTDGAPEHATTGYYLEAVADGPGSVVLRVPATATHYAVANAVDSDTQVVSVTQGN